MPVAVQEGIRGRGGGNTSGMKLRKRRRSFGLLSGLLAAVGGLLAGVFGLLRGVLVGLGRLLRRVF